MADYSEVLQNALDNIESAGSFATTGSFPHGVQPTMVVDGLGPVALPITHECARSLVAQAEQAPFGKGLQTVVDTEVRRTWQIGSERVHISGDGWNGSFAQVLSEVAAALGLDVGIEAQ